jgi:phosphoglycerol transferase MdoB-like AlkP superfamily enzyme
MIFVSYFGDWNTLSHNFSDFLDSLVYGFRYDTIAISYLLLPIFLGNIVQSLFRNQRLYKYFLIISKFYFYLLSLIYIVLLATDIGFYSYFQDHINILIFGFFEDDTQALLLTLYNNYPVFKGLFAFVATLILLYVATQKLFKNNLKSVLEKSLVVGSTQLLVMLVLFIGALRGGYSIFVLSPKYADFSTNEFINQSAYNGVLAFSETVKMRSENTRKDFKLEDTLGYQKNIIKAIKDYSGKMAVENLEKTLVRKTGKNILVETDPPHVVVFLMESFGASWLEFQSESFNFLGSLEAHIKEDYYSPFMTSIGRGTIGSFVGLITNNPRRPGRRFLSESRYMNLPLKSAASLPFKRAGYETRMIYGGKLAWRGIGKYSLMQGFDIQEGEAQIRDNLKLEGEQGTEWGLYDEHLYTHIKKILKQASKPQFIFVLTTTNHPPFQYPKAYKTPKLVISGELDKKISRERHLFQKRFETFRYTNDKLGDFISDIKNDNELKDKTIISFTGDHNFWGFRNYSRKESFLKYTVPFYTYIPARLNLGYKLKRNMPMGHEDIMTSLYNISLSDSDFISFGQNLFDAHIEPNSIGSSIYADKSGVYYENKFYKWDAFPYIQEISSETNSSNSIFYRSLLSVSDYFIREQSKE